MDTLECFSPNVEDEISLCEVDGRLHSMKYEYANINAFTNSVDRHPKIHITRDMLHCVVSGDESRALFLPVHEPVFKQVAQIWFEQGLVECLRFIASETRNTSNVPKIIAKWSLRMIDSFSRIQNIFQPFTHKNRKNIIAMFSQTRNWPESLIRCIAWHPHCTKIAVAASDDSVRLYSTDSTLVPILKSKMQKSISCMAWRPLSASEIAIACESCILIWTVDPNSVVTRPSSANSYVLRRVNHCPVTSIAWSPYGELLVSASANSSSLLVWDVALDKTCSLHSAGSVGNTLLCWSSDGRRLVSASSGLVFRVWECQYWGTERWNTSTGHIQSACWSPCGNILLFATSNECIIYSLCFEPGSLLLGSNPEALIFNNSKAVMNTSPKQATPLIDVNKVLLGNDQVVGGLVQAMDWDANGRHLAILFKDTPYVAVFMTRCKPNIHITPSSLISGLPGEYPCLISFQKNFKEGACLTIGWSSGRLQFFPIIYSDSAVSDSPIFESGNPTINSLNYDSFRNYSGYQ